MSGAVIWIIDSEHWPRAFLRAELIERGYDAVGYLTVDDALRTIPWRWPDLIIVELRGLAREEVDRLFGGNVPVIGIAGVPEINEPWLAEYPFAAVLQRPVSIGEIVQRVAQILPVR
jgi:DNA-binding response OmpR family regulator